MVLWVMGVDALSGVLKTAVSLFSPSFTTKSQEERIPILENLNDEQLAQLNSLDKQLY